MEGNGVDIDVVLLSDAYHHLSGFVAPLTAFSPPQEVVQDLGEELTNEEIMEMITYFKVVR